MQDTRKLANKGTTRTESRMRRDLLTHETVLSDCYRNAHPQRVFVTFRKFALQLFQHFECNRGNPRESRIGIREGEEGRWPCRKKTEADPRLIEYRWLAYPMELRPADLK